MEVTTWRAFGALVGVGAGVLGGIGLRAAFSSGAGWVLIGIGIAIVVSVVLYLVARPFTTPATRAAEYMLGLLLGVNTGVNAAFLEALFGIVPAVIICLVPLLAVIEPVARADVFQFFLGWVNWALPMSWPIVALGLLVFLVSLPLGLIPGAFTRIEKVTGDLKTGTWILVGGMGGNANLSPHSTGYNLGTFAFLRRGNPAGDYLVSHEAGHTLNLAIWGAIVHLIGALDENVFGGGVNAYTEHFAEGNVPVALRHHDHPAFPMWGEATGATPPVPATPPMPPTPAPV